MSEPVPPPGPPLPDGWEARFDAAKQRWFYVDHVNRKTQWERPGPAGPPPPRPAQPHRPQPAAPAAEGWTSVGAGADERDIATLLKVHGAEVQRLREATRDVATEPEHDMLYFLRYALEFPHDEAVAHIRWAVQWRRHPVHAYWLERARRKEERLHRDPSDHHTDHLTISALHAGPKDGGPMQVLRPGLIDFSPIMAIHEHERMVLYHVMGKEVAFRRVDRMSRETGRLIKMMVVNDFTGMPMTAPPKSVMKSYSDAGSISKKLYPQLSMPTIAKNCPTWFKMALKAGSFFGSDGAKSFQQCPGKGSIEKCPFATKYLNLQQVPSFLGGPCRCPGGCVPGLDNDCKTRRTLGAEEVEKLLADAKSEAEREKQEIAEFVEQWKVQHPEWCT